MAVYKCKMCSGELDVSDGISVIECDYCGTKQTVPQAKDENLQGLFNRANTLRKKSEFDKSEQIYEKILQKDPSQAEAYWGLILCKYGIEYVEDPATFKRIPTCHRASFDSIVSDEDYKSALENADAVQRAIYESEAKEIDRIQKEIIAISSKEEPYDVFICYKEADDSGKRTQDSVIANDIYYQLAKEGYKVFYAAITLEDKLGSAYEPCIFAALNSAKVMLVVGTRPEYFNAVWVRNEWSRFLKLMKKDREKLLIPCYKDMDAYELPEEFSHLQAQDMGKIGFINDIIRGVVKLTNKKEIEATKQTIITATSDANIEPLLKRVFMFLEDGDWKSADDYAEKVLDKDPENASAYLGKLMSDLKVKTKTDLSKLPSPFDNNAYYKKVLRFADDALKSELNEYIRIINERNTKASYDYAVKKMNTAGKADDFRKAASMFAEIIDYKNSRDLNRECLEKANEAGKKHSYDIAVSKMQSNDINKVREAVETFKSLKDWKDSVQRIEICKTKIVELTDIEKKNSEIKKQKQSCQQEIEKLNNKKEAIESQINFLAFERTAPAGCIGKFFLVVGIFMAIIGLLLISLGDGESAWLGLVAIPEFALAALFMRKFPSKSVIKENYRKKDEYLAEIRKIDEELVELNKQLSDISKMTVNR